MLSLTLTLTLTLSLMLIPLDSHLLILLEMLSML
jgi:hypothetical protein